MPDSYSPSGILMSAIKQKLNCALPSFSLASLTFVCEGFIAYRKRGKQECLPTIGLAIDLAIALFFSKR
jgi:hypothetical protein